MRRLFVLPATLLLLLVSQPVLAGSADVDVTVNVAQVLAVEYTGDPVIVFRIGYPDLIEGSVGKVNQGDIIWCANFAPWMIMVERTEWQTEDGNPDLELWLQVKYGPPDNSAWITVETYPTDWILGGSTGTGTFDGVDWKVKALPFEMQPGTYWCTVTITIVPMEPYSV